MACIKWSQPVFTPFGRNVILAKHFPKRNLGRNPRIDLISPTVKPNPLNPLTESPPPMYWLGTHRWCPRACTSATTIWVCLLLFPRHFCHSYIIFFCYAYCVMFIFCGLSLSLGFLSPFPLSLPLIRLMGLLTVIPAMLAH